MLALPVAPTAGVNVSVPLLLIAGPDAKSAVFVFAVTSNVSTCPVSFGPALMLVAQFACEYAPPLLSTTTLPPPVNDGASFTAFTVMVLVCDADVSLPPLAPPPLSCSVTVIVALPYAFAAGVNVSVPFDATDGCTLKSELLVFVVVNVTVCPDSSEGPAEIEVAQLEYVCAPASSSTDSVGPTRNDGASLTDATVMFATPSSVPPLPSLARKVKLSVPL